MPASARAELTVEIRVIPDTALEATKRVAGETGLAHEASPQTINLSGGRSDVLDATRKVMEAALEAGADSVEIKVETEGDADRF